MVNVDGPNLFITSVLGEIEASEVALDKVFSLVRKETKITTQILKDKGGTKEDLAETIIRLVNRIQKNVQIMKKTCGEVEGHMHQTKEAEKRVIGIQGELIDCQKNQIKRFENVIETSLQTTLKSEIKGYSDAIKKSTSVQPSVIIGSIKSAVKDAVNNVTTDADRKKNVIVFGLQECVEEDLSKNVNDLLLEINLKPQVEKVTRLGRYSETKCRPVRVSLNKSDTVHEILKVSKALKSSVNFNSVYISIDRNLEQRKKHNELVIQLKENIKKFPNKHFYIKGDRLLESTDHGHRDSHESELKKEITPTYRESEPISDHEDLFIVIEG